jgi:hypothetical protein
MNIKCCVDIVILLFIMACVEYLWALHESNDKEDK